MQIDLKTQLHYARFIQLSIVFIFGLYVYLFTTIPHNWWIFLTILMMMSVIQPGLILARSISRGKGTIVGIIISFVVVYTLHLNYRLVSIFFVLSMVLMFVPNQKRYDITVTIMTIMVFLADPYLYKFPLLEGPVEVAINRMTCTIIGIAICVASDYILFNRFNYSGKAYRVLQEELLGVIQAQLGDILEDKKVRKNRLILIKHMRDNFNNIFGQISASAEGLLISYSSSEELKNTVRRFSEISWQLRIETSAIYVANCILDEDAILIERHLQKFKLLLSEARNNLLKI